MTREEVLEAIKLSGKLEWEGDLIDVALHYPTSFPQHLQPLASQLAEAYSELERATVQLLDDVNEYIDSLDQDEVEKLYGEL